MEKETKKIGVKIVFAWIFSLLFILLGMIFFSSSALQGIFYILAGTIILPPFGRFLKKKANLEISTSLKVLIFFILWAMGGFASYF